MHHQKKIKQPKSFIRRYGLAVLAVLLLASGAYILTLVFTPQLSMSTVSKTWNKPVPRAAADLTENRLYIPKLKLNLTYKAGNASVLRDNAWHRFPERGDPEKGGNFILAGHRFDIGLTPGETKRRSPFYHIDALAPGNKIYADFNGKRYLYEVTERFKVKPTQTEIEAPSNEPKMTLYTCTLQGSADGREVIIAHLVKKDIDPPKTLDE
jgi:sortase A